MAERKKAAAVRHESDGVPDRKPSIARRLGEAVAGIAVLALIGFGAFSLHGKRLEALQRTPAMNEYPWALRSVRVDKQDLTVGFPVLARMESRSEVTISPQISGVIQQLGPREGQAVKKGWLLARIDTLELENSLAALKASLVGAKADADYQAKELKRQKALLKKGFAAQDLVDRLSAQLDASRQRVKQLRGQIEALKTRLAYGTILSPVDGVIAARLQEVGDLASPGRPLYRITAEGGVKISVSVPQHVLERLAPGSKIVLTQDDREQTVRITRIFPDLDALSLGTVEADVDTMPFRLPSGARIPGRVIMNEYPGSLVVPLAAVAFSPDDSRGVVFRLQKDDGGTGYVLKKVPVRIAARGHEGVGVTGDLQPGDRVVTAKESILLSLRDNDPVVPEPESREPRQ